MTRELPALPPDDPSRKNPKPSNPRSPWRAYNPGWLRERSPQWQEKRRGR